MKLTAVLITVACLQVSAHSSAQNRITFSGKDVLLEKVFSIIKKQTGYLFFYNKETIQNTKVTLDVKEASVEEVMVLCLKDCGLDYTVEGKTIFIIKKQELEKKEDRNVSSPLDEIKGRITNAQGEPLSGANVFIKRTSRGTQTDVNGNFMLRNVNADDILTISYTGYRPISIKAGGRTNLILVMDIATNELDKVIIQAYGTTTQRLNTANIATVTATEIERQPVMNPLQTLQGRVSGLIISQTSGYASAPIKVEIRGRNSINNPFSDPLYIIDGVPLTTLDIPGGLGGFIQGGVTSPAYGQSPFFSINPADIESITVLKDGDATAIYGSRGANGVIVITTKKGKPGKTKFDLNIYTGVSKVTRSYEMLNTQQYLDMRREAFYNDSITYGIKMDPGSAPDLLIWDTERFTDWQKYLFGGTGKMIDLQMSLSGGDKQTNFRIGGTYHRQTDILSVSGADQRTAIQFNLSHKSLNQRLNIAFSNAFSYNRSDLTFIGSSVTLPPNAPAVFDDQGHLNYRGWDPISDQFTFGNLLQPYVSKTQYLNSRLNLKYEFIKGLSFSTNLGYSTNKIAQTSITPIIAQNPSSNPTGTSRFGNNNRSELIIEPQSEYTGLIGRGKINAFIGGSIQRVDVNASTIGGSGYINDNLLGSIANAPVKGASDFSLQYRYAALFGRINYNRDNKYILNFSVRRDGSSRFGSGKQFGNFGALGAAWIFTEEKWFKNLQWLSFGKLRSSYGITGSDLIGDYQFLTRWSSANIFAFQGITSNVPLQHANPDLQWQENRKLEIALNLGFLKDRLSIEISWYRNRCGNQLVTIPLPALTGFIQVSGNFPATVQNMGWETTMKAKLIEKKDFDWSLNFNAGMNQNILLSFPNLLQSSYAARYVVGESLNIIRLLRSTGVDPQTGLYTFEDKSKDGQINISGNNTGDLYSKDLSIKLEGGFGTDLYYKGLQLNLFFHFRKQDAKSAIYSSRYPGGFANQSPQVLDHWQRPGDIAKFARYTTQEDPTDYYFTQSDAVYCDASFIRLQNLSLSYDMPNKWVKKVGMQGCKIYLRGENLFLITKYNGVDPEIPAFGGLPPSKVLTAGIQFNF